jgi:hypothetical protein
MCTVTYLPLKEGFLITSNRDERLSRKPSNPPVVQVVNGIALLFPKDTEAGGTWIACAQNGRTVCLLNGAFEPHILNPPYRKSRGLVVLDYFQSKSVKEFERQYDLTGIEPFTMVIAEDKLLFEVRWDGTKKYLSQLDETKPNIHSSATLYNKETMALREEWFNNWLITHTDYRVEDILNFHLFAGDGDAAHNIRMSRFGIVETLSVTSIKLENNVVEMYYADLKDKKEADFGVYTFATNDIKEGNFTIAN